MPPPTKKRKLTTSAPAEITFDPAAREEYLTGFHKRKLARIKHAQEEAAKKEKEERPPSKKRGTLSTFPTINCLNNLLQSGTSSRLARQERKEELERHVSEVNALLKKANEDFGLGVEEGQGRDEEEWEGFEEPKVEEIDREEEYIDEDKYTTVTIESVGITKDGFEKVRDAGTEEEENKENGAEGKGDDSKKRAWTKEKPKTDRPKKKKKKFRYENKAERKATNAKQRMKGKVAAAARKAK